MARRPLLLSSVLLRQNPHNVVEWLKRVNEKMEEKGCVLASALALSSCFIPFLSMLFSPLFVSSFRPFFVRPVLIPSLACLFPSMFVRVHIVLGGAVQGRRRLARRHRVLHRGRENRGPFSGTCWAGFSFSASSSSSSSSLLSMSDFLHPSRRHVYFYSRRWGSPKSSGSGLRGFTKCTATWRRAAPY